MTQLSKPLPFEISIYWISIFRAPTSSLRPILLNYSFTHKASVFLFSTPTRLGDFSSTTFPPTLSTISRFSSSVPTELGGFSLIDLAGFPSQFPYWVRKFFTKLPKWLHVWRGSRLREKTIVIPWSCDGLVKVIWSRLYVNGHVIPILSHHLLSTNLPTSFILKSYMPHFQLPTSFATVTSNSLSPPSYRLGYYLSYISTRSFWSRSPMRLSEPLLDWWLARKNYFQISAFCVRWWWSKRRSTKESHWRSHEWSGEKSAG